MLIGVIYIYITYTLLFAEQNNPFNCTILSRGTKGEEKDSTNTIEQVEQFNCLYTAICSS